MSKDPPGVEPEHLVGTDSTSPPWGATLTTSNTTTTTAEARQLAKHWDEEDRRLKKEARRAPHPEDTAAPEDSVPGAVSQHSEPLPKKHGLRNRPGIPTLLSSPSQTHARAPPPTKRQPFPTSKFRWRDPPDGARASNPLPAEDAVEDESAHGNNGVVRGGGDDHGDVPNNDAAILVEARLVVEETSAVNLAATGGDVEANHAATTIPRAEIVPESKTGFSKYAPTSARGAWLCFGICFLLASVTITGIVCGAGLCMPQEDDDPMPKENDDLIAPLPTYTPAVLIQPIGHDNQDANINSSPVATPFPSESPTTVTLFGWSFPTKNTTQVLLGGKGLGGTLPTEIGLLTVLTDLNLYNNSVSGSIPSQLGMLTLLQMLRLWGNPTLRGNIPSELGLLTSLQGQLAITESLLTGSIPTELGRLRFVDSILLYDNQLTGPIPSEFGQLTYLNDLGLNENLMTGLIPTELGLLTNRFRGELGLFRNAFAGTIPSVLGLLTSMTKLLLWENDHTGTIPSELGRLTDLIWLALSSNDLQGPIPSELGRLTQLEYFDLFSNRLTGTVPSSVCSFSSLEAFYIDCDENMTTCPVSCDNCVCK